MKPPDRFESWNPALRGAFRKGYVARGAGESIEACPYIDRRNLSGRLTWSRAFIKAWEDGWHYADIGLDVDGIGPEWDSEYDDTGE